MALVQADLEPLAEPAGPLAEPAAPIPYSSHYLMLVDYNRARQASHDFIQNFGAILIHQIGRPTGISQNMDFHYTIYLRIPGSRVIFEFQDTGRALHV